MKNLLKKAIENLDFDYKNKYFILSSAFVFFLISLLVLTYSIALIRSNNNGDINLNPINNPSNNSQQDSSNPTSNFVGDNDSEIICIDSSIEDDLRNNITSLTYNTGTIAFSKQLSEECDVAISREAFDGAKAAAQSPIVLATRFDTFPTLKLTAEDFDEFVKNRIFNNNILEISSEVAQNFELPETYVPKTANEIAEITKTSKDKYMLIPFSAMRPEFKIVDINEVSPISPNYSQNIYPYQSSIFIRANENSKTIETISEQIDQYNFNQNKLTDVMLTGTSVLGARSQFNIIDSKNDNLYPVRKIADTLRSADISHVSNETSYTDRCTQAEQTLVFCGLPSSVEMLTHMGVDVVGLTGNQLLDYGRADFLSTLELYDQNNIEYFGGGDNLESANEALIIENNGTKIAFLGYNFVGPVAIYATETRSGNVPANFTEIESEVLKAKSEADVVIVDFQWGVNTFTRDPSADVHRSFAQAAINSGADIINGVHASWVQGIEYSNDTVIFNSLGNFSFDQLFEEEVRTGMIAQHFFYNGQHITYNLIPTFINNTFQTELATEEQSKALLEEVYNYSKL